MKERSAGYSMKRRFPLRLKWLFAGVVVALGCVESDRALVDEKTSIIDADLIGEWRLVGDDPESSSLVIRKKPGSETVLEAVDDESEPVDLPIAKIGDEQYLCLKIIPEDTKKSTTFWIFRYEFRDDNEVAFYALNVPAIYDAINQRQLAGKTWWLFGKSARISDDPLAIRDYLEKHGDRCFERDALTVLRRVNKTANRWTIPLDLEKRYDESCGALGIGYSQPAHDAAISPPRSFPGGPQSYRVGGDKR